MDKERIEELSKRPFFKMFPDKVDDLKNRICTCCKEHIFYKHFKNELSIKEYRISGMCQKCQDGVFK
ncbi:hypothetical protein LCGC14_2708490 [marine sediment metagenome]|uniref:Uncharacterized protein n=1 Tax=marine sediment metagenome TaxID=412755 RepID=A0A0F9A1D4_9ZZZZ